MYGLIIQITNQALWDNRYCFKRHIGYPTAPGNKIIISETYCSKFFKGIHRSVSTAASKQEVCYLRVQVPFIKKLNKTLQLLKISEQSD